MKTCLLPKACEAGGPALYGDRRICARPNSGGLATSSSVRFQTGRTKNSRLATRPFKECRLLNRRVPVMAEQPKGSDDQIERPLAAALREPCSGKLGAADCGELQVSRPRGKPRLNRKYPRIQALRACPRRTRLQPDSRITRSRAYSVPCNSDRTQRLVPRAIPRAGPGGNPARCKASGLPAARDGPVFPR